TIPQAAYDAGWRGASVWSTPTYDTQSKLLYVTTGNYFQEGSGTDPGVEDGVIALDARSGAVRWTNQLVFGDVWTVTIVPGPDSPFSPPTGGDLYAVSLDGKTLLWDFKTPGPNGSGVAIANGVVYFQSLDGTLYALDARAPDAAHALLASFPTGGNYGGPAVANGHVYVGTGSAVPIAPFTQYHNGISAYGLPPAE